MLDRISFSHYFNEVKHQLPSDLIKLINPETMMFFKSGNVYLAMMADNDSLVVAMASGEGADFIRDLREETHKYGIRFVKFMTSVDNRPVNTIARYCKAKKTGVIADYYGKGKDANCYTIETHNTRFDK